MAYKIEKIPLLHELCQGEIPRAEKTIEVQQLQSMCFVYGQEKRFLANWKKNWTYNQFLYQELVAFDQTLQKDPIQYEGVPIILKGLSFYQRLYFDLGARQITDIDLYISPKYFSYYSQILQKIGFNTEFQIQKEKSIPNKTIFKKKIDIISTEFVIELHTKIFPLRNVPFPSQRLLSGHPCFKQFFVLDFVSEFVFLSYHYAFQHTFLRLQWAIDLYLLWQSQGQDVSKQVPAILSLAKEVGAEQSVLYVFYILKNHFAITTIPESPCLNWYKRPSLTFILSPSKNVLSYFFIKQWTKDHWKDQFKENIRLLSDLFKKDSEH